MLDWKFLQMEKMIAWCLWLSDIIQILPGRSLRDFFPRHYFYLYRLEYLFSTLKQYHVVLRHPTAHWARESALLNTGLRWKIINNLVSAFSNDWVKRQINSLFYMREKDTIERGICTVWNDTFFLGVTR